MNETPFVSVVMPNFDGARHIEESIQSIINQSYKNWELVICDDGSTDNSWEIIERLAKNDERISIYKNKTNLGNPKNRNKLLSLVSVDTVYIAVLDSDDVALPHRLQSQIKFLEDNQEVGLVGSAITIIDEHSKDQGIRTYPTTHKDISKKIMMFDPFAQPAVMVRSAALKQVGLYDENLARCQDYDLFTRFIKKGIKTANLSEPLTKFRIHSNQGKYQNIRKAFKYSFIVRNRYLFSKQFFSLQGFFMWGVYLGGYLSSFVLPKKTYAVIFDTLFVKNKTENIS